MCNVHYVIDRDIDVLCLTETWMQNEDQVSSVNFLPLIMHSSMYPMFRLTTTMVVLASCINRNLTLVKLQILTFLTLNPLNLPSSLICHTHCILSWCTDPTRHLRINSQVNFFSKSLIISLFRYFARKSLAPW